MTETLHFYFNGGEFGVIKFTDDFSALVLAPTKQKEPLRYDAATIAKHSSNVDGDQGTKARHGVTQLLKLIGIWIREESLESPPLIEGSYFPRIWRGVYFPTDPLKCYTPIDARSTYGAAYIQSVTAARSLFEQLEQLFRHIEPTHPNKDTFGHRVRELLILASTEVEAAWRGVWSQNHAKGTQSARLTTNDYVRLEAPLGLRQWAVELVDYPDYGVIRPFANWNTSSPTQSLPWYDAYNSTKHDREARFDCASLANLVSAMAALHIELSAQWGPGVFDKWFAAVPSPFRIVEHPKRRAGEIYAPIIGTDLSLTWCPSFLFDAGSGAEPKPA